MRAGLIAGSLRLVDQMESSHSSSVGRVSRGIMHVFAGEETSARSSKAILRRRVGFRTGSR